MHQTTAGIDYPYPAPRTQLPRPVGFSPKVSDTLKYKSDSFLRIPTLSKSVFSGPNATSRWGSPRSRASEAKGQA